MREGKNLSAIEENIDININTASTQKGNHKKHFNETKIL
jgi:hypothetical protein